MVNRKLVHYVRKHSMHFSDTQLYHRLVHKGHHPNDAKEAINFVKLGKNLPLLPFKISGKLIYGIIGMIIIILIFLILLSFRPVCGNGEIEFGEDTDNCCIDVGCFGDQSCQDNVCTNPVCGECQFFSESSYRCIDYECCDDYGCSENEVCRANTCYEIV